MSPRPFDIARELGVTPEDSETIKISRRKVLLTRVAQVGVTILGAISGFAAGKVASSESQTHNTYPYAPLWITPSLLVGMPRKSWIATIIVAAIAFLMFFIMTYSLSGTGGSPGSDGVIPMYGVTPKYGTYCRKLRPGLPQPL